MHAQKVLERSYGLDEEEKQSKMPHSFRTGHESCAYLAWHAFAAAVVSPRPLTLGTALSRSSYLALRTCGPSDSLSPRSEDFGPVAVAARSGVGPIPFHVDTGCQWHGLY